MDVFSGVMVDLSKVQTCLTDPMLMLLLEPWQELCG
ncbi:hypothetical protein L914_00615 [Phytophthora nicotianae]|uniref:Uncharacterized protein n=1 Tax=Phytophthora nicotianae TaxID=4792 RepID=W2P6G7_PHYNI|nr:hypothetical protein L914_00615 [Phytophthora nicotianae]